jgi:O-antigen/teichoic acid export membrane protein
MSIRKLAGETAIYGGAHIVGKLINFLLVPIHTATFSDVEYGARSFLYAAIPLLSVLMTYRMEVAYFRFGTENKNTENIAFATSAVSILISTIVISALLFLAVPFIADSQGFSTQHYLFYLAIGILSVDAINTILYAKLRLDGRPIQFAIANLSGVIVTVVCNLFFLIYAPTTSFFEGWYSPTFGIGYIFLANLLGSFTSLLLLSPLFRKIRFSSIDRATWVKMRKFAVPLILVGLSFVVNETFDRLIMNSIAPGDTPEARKAATGIYSGVYALTMFIALFRQAFQYAGEPFFFNQKTTANAQQIYADVTQFFTVIVAVAFLFVMLYLDLLKLLLLRNESYWAGLHVVPILLLANLLLGIYYNFSVWYKVTDRTEWGAYISLIGAAITVVFNLIFIPKYSYTAAAWVTLAAYSTMTFLSYWIGQRHYPVPYAIGKMVISVLLAVSFWLVSEGITRVTSLNNPYVLYSMNTVILIIFLIIAYQMEKSNIRKYFFRQA